MEGQTINFPVSLNRAPDGLWAGSSFGITYDQRVGNLEQVNLVQNYSKATERWAPKYERRPKRYVKYLSIRECMPEVDALHLYSKAYYTKTEQAGAVHNQVRDLAGKILNRTYDKYHAVKYTYGTRSSIGVSTGTPSYSALSMSSGEQRVFNILDAVVGAPKYGLVLIDEIDLFLHEDALYKLLTILGTHCREKKKQLLFTSHFPSIAESGGDISVMTLHRTPSRTIVWNGYSVEALRHITGKSVRPISIYIEDDVSAAIIGQVCSELAMRQYVATITFGTAGNAYSVGAGLILSQLDINKTLILTDGDEIVTSSERRRECNRVLTGTDTIRTRQRRQLRALVRMFRSPFLKNPEEMLHAFVCAAPMASLSLEDMELRRNALEIINPLDNHGFINILVERSGQPRTVCLSHISRVASKAPGWRAYTRLPRSYTRLPRFWLSKKREELNLNGPTAQA